MTWSYVGIAILAIIGFGMGKVDYRLALLALALIWIQWANFNKLERSVAALERKIDFSHVRSGSDNTAFGSAAKQSGETAHE